MEVARSTDTHCIRHDDCVRVKNNDRVINFFCFVVWLSTSVLQRISAVESLLSFNGLRYGSKNP